MPGIALGRYARCLCVSERAADGLQCRPRMFLNSSTLASLRFFEAAARLSSFKEAALELHVSQGAVSQQIKQLEEALGCKLFYRLTRQIALTDEGRRFAAIVARSLGDIEREARTLAAAHARIAIRVRAAPSFALRWLVPRLGEFYAQHPDIKLSITAVHGYFDPARREFDLAIESSKGKVPVLHSEALMEDYLVPVCSPKYLAKHAFLKKPRDLARCTLLHDGQPWIGADEDAEWRHWLKEVGGVDVDSTQGQFFSLANMAIEAALTHQGVAMGRTSLVQDLLEAGELVAPLAQPVKSATKYWLAYPGELVSNPGLQAVIRWLRRQAAKRPSRESPA
jgi:LysR family glycine cleavage system transcriptional activator